MTLNCGVEAHDDDCLCDVVVTSPTPIMNDWVRDSWLGKEIVQLLGLSSPWTDDKIILLSETQLAVHDEWAERRRTSGSEALKAVRAMRPNKIDAEQEEELKEILANGGTSGDLKKYCDTMFGIEISRSWACKLRVRLLKEMGKHEVH